MGVRETQKFITDHQSLTYAPSNRNTNNKMKRWKAILKEYNYELYYRSGRTHTVADSLSRIPNQVNTLSDATHGDESTREDLIPFVEVRINVFRNQIFFKVAETASYQFQTVFLLNT